MTWCVKEQHNCGYATSYGMCGVTCCVNKNQTIRYDIPDNMQGYSISGSSRRVVFSDEFKEALKEVIKEVLEKENETNRQE